MKNVLASGRAARLLCLAIGLVATLTLVRAATGPELSIDPASFELTGSTRVTRTLFDYTYRADVLNTGAAADSVVAALTSTSPHTTVIDGELVFGQVPANASVASLDTFTIRQDRTHPFDPAALQWTFSFAQPANTPPVADAGADQTVFTGSLVTLNGGGSSDADGDALTFAWSIVAAPPGSSAVLSDATAVAPTFVADVEGVFEIQLVVNDGQASSAPDVVRVTTIPLNTDPVADAGPDQHVVVGDTVQLDGSGSTDVDGDTLAFSWAFVSVPPGSTAGLSDAGAVQPTFVPDLLGTYVVRLTVDDGNGGSDSDEVTITTELANRAPVANAGADQAVEVGETVLLDGSGSGDPDGDALTYAWSFVSRPAGSTATIADPNAPQTGFVADRAGVFIVQLIVNDGELDSAPDTVMVTTSNTPPVADAGPDQAVTAGETVQLDGTGSSDANGDPLAWFWSFTARPAGSSADFSDPLSPMPTFEADEPGVFVVQLIVNDGTVDSAPDTATITADALPTLSIGDASVDEGDSGTTLMTFSVTISAAPGDDVTVDFATADDTATAGTDYQAAAGTLTFPAGSAAAQTIEIAVNGDGDVEPDETFFVQLSSPVNATLAEGQGTGTIVNDDAQAAITLAPASVTLLTGDSAALTVTLGEPAGPGGQAVDLAISPGNVATVPAAVIVPAGATSAQFDVTAGQAAGTAVITASAAGFTSGTSNVTVNDRGLTVTLASPLVGVGRSIGGSVTLDEPAPAGGVSVTVASGNTALATVNPTTLAIAAGDTSAAFTVEGVSPGTTTIDASASGFERASAPLEVTGNLISIGSIPVIGPGQSASLPISLSSPAAGDVIVNLTSADPGIATVTPSIVIPDGQQVPAANAQVTGVDFGTTQISAAASGFAPDSREVTVSVSLTFSPDSLTLNQGAEGTLSLSASAPAPAGGLTLSLSSDDPAVATVPASVDIPAGQSSAQVTVTAEAQGSTTIRASGTGIDETTASVTVNPPQLVFINNTATPATLRVGENLQDSHVVRLQSAPPSPVTITLSVPAGSGVLLGTTASGAGSPTISFPGVADTGNRTFWVQGLTEGAATTLTASAPGYGDATVTVAVDPSGFVINSPTGDFTTDAFAANTTLLVNPARLNAGTLTFGTFQGVRGGFSMQVPVTSSNTAAGVITTSPVTFADGAGINQVSTQFDPLAAGTTTINVVQPAGFEAPSNPAAGRNTELTVTVTGSSVFVNGSATPAPIRVGENLQDSQLVRLQSVPPEPVTITLSVPAGSGVLLGTTASGAGSPTISFPNVADTGNRTFWVQGLTEGAATTLTASAPGYGDATVTVAVDPSGFVINSPTGDFTTDAFAANTTLLVNPARLNAGTLTFGTFQGVRGGFSVQVPVTSSNPAAGVITTSPLTFADGAGINQVSTQFDPLAAGTTTINVVQPAGFEAPSNPAAGRNTELTVTVTGSSVFINNTATPATLRVGENLQDSHVVRLQSAPPSPVTITLSVPAGSGVLLGTTASGAGSPTITFPDVANTGNRTFWVQGLTEGVATTLTASAPGYGDVTVPVVVDPSGFVINSPTGDFTTDAFAANTTLLVNPARLNAGTLTFGTFQGVRGGFSVQVPVTSSNPAAGVITTSPLTFADGAGINQVSTQFDPLAAGTTTISVAQPAGFEAPSNPAAGRNTELTVTVEQSVVLINNSQAPAPIRVGENLQDSQVVRLQSAPPSPVTITLSVPAGSGVLLGTTANGAGSPTISFPNVANAANRTFWVQGLTEGVSTTLTASAPGYGDATVTVAVDPSGFVISTPTTDFTTGASSGNTTLLVNPVRLNAGTLTFATFQGVRGGFSVQVPVTSSDPAVGVITTSPLTFADGIGINQVSTQFDPLAAGTSTISVTQPAGFDAIAISTSGARTAITATVNP